MGNSKQKWDLPHSSMEVPSPKEDVEESLRSGDAEAQLINEPTKLSGKEFDEWMSFVTYCGQDDQVSPDVIEEVTRAPAQPRRRKRNSFLRMNRR